MRRNKRANCVVQVQSLRSIGCWYTQLQSGPAFMLNSPGITGNWSRDFDVMLQLEDSHVPQRAEVVDPILQAAA